MTNSNLFCRRMFAQCHSNFQLNYRFANLLNLARVFFTILELFVWKKVIKIRIFIKKLREKFEFKAVIHQLINKLLDWQENHLKLSKFYSIFIQILAPNFSFLLKSLGIYWNFWRFCWKALQIQLKRRFSLANNLI